MQRETRIRMHVRFALAFFFIAPLSYAEVPGISPAPKVDSRGYIDVWALRADLAKVEPFVADDNSDGCYREGDGDADEGRLTAKQKKRLEQQRSRELEREQACSAKVQKRYADYQQLKSRFNDAWLPLMLEAIKKGDTVAEVILILCDTTPVLDRTRHISTCADGQSNPLQAIARLREIGFYPAVPIDHEPGYCEFKGCGSPSPKGRETLQEIVLNAFRHGNFGEFRYEATGYWGVQEDALAFRLARNAALIEAARQDVPRAFLIDPDGRGHAFARGLAINRLPRRPESLTWGPEKLGESNLIERSRRDHWRTLPFSPTLCKGDVFAPGRGICKEVEFGRHIPRDPKMMYPDPLVTDANFENDLKMLLDKTEANIGRYLNQDPRWAVFLVNRVGHHEWLPERTESKSGVLDQSWLGQWALVRSYVNFVPVEAPGEVNAVITQANNVARITLRSAQPLYAPLENATNCTLRYSGGSTPFGFGTAEHAARFFEGVLPLFIRPNLPQGFELLDPKKRYKQVLLQCPEAEMPNNDRVRFLLLVGDVLLEIAADQTERKNLHVRHFERKKEGGTLIDHPSEPISLKPNDRN